MKILTSILFLILMGCATTPLPVPEFSTHNEAMRWLEANPPSKVTLWYFKVEYNDGKYKETRQNVIRIKKPGEVSKLFSLLTVDNEPILNADGQFEGTVMSHFCSGNIKIEFDLGEKKALLSFDHGEGIVTQFGHGDYLELPEDNLNKLIGELKSLGFSESNMGIHKDI